MSEEGSLIVDLERLLDCSLPQTLKGMCDECGMLVVRGDEHHHAAGEEQAPIVHPQWAYIFPGGSPTHRAKGYSVR